MTDQEILDLARQCSEKNLALGSAGELEATMNRGLLMFANSLLSRAIPEGHVVVPGWMPIESAPKDGTAVLLYTADGVIEGYWQQDRWEQYTIYCTYDAAGGPAFNANPTHWMPLPAAPANKEG